MDKMLKLKEKDYQSGLKIQTPPPKKMCAAYKWHSLNVIIEKGWKHGKRYTMQILATKIWQNWVNIKQVECKAGMICWNNQGHFTMIKSIQLTKKVHDSKFTRRY